MDTQFKAFISSSAEAPLAPGPGNDRLWNHVTSALCDNRAPRGGFWSDDRLQWSVSGFPLICASPLRSSI